MKFSVLFVPLLSCNILHLYVAARDVFRLLNTKYKKLELQVGASFFEIYSGKVSFE